MRKLLILQVALLLFSTITSGQVATLKGRIYDLQTGSSLSGASIIYGPNQGVISGVEGNYTLRTKPGNTRITVRYIGYQTLTINVVLLPDGFRILDVGLKPQSSEIDQVVVSAGRAEQHISELSVSMNVLKPEALNDNHITDTKELINKIPGIEVLDGQASVRGGSGFSYGAGSRVLALVDGLPAMSADAGNIKWSYLPLENLSQIEIIKGASSVIYGSSALNGVINFRSADATPKPQTRFFAESGFYGKPANNNWKWWNSPRVFNSASVSHLEKFGNTDLGVSLQLTDDKGYRRLNTDRHGLASLRLKHTSKKMKGLKYGLGLTGGKSLKTDFVLWENAANGALKQSESTAIELHGSYFTLDPFVEFNKKKSKHDLKARYQLSKNDFPQSEQNNSTASVFFGEYLFQHQFTSKINLTSGVSENLNMIASNFYGDHQGFNLGIFSQLEASPVNKLKFTAGVRLEQNWLDAVYDKLIPLFRAGLNFRALNHTFLRASFGQGYRFPSVAEKYASTTLGSVRIFPSLYIQPEKGWNSEVGVKQGITVAGFTGFADLALFYLQNTNMIEFIFGNYPIPGKDSYALGFKATNIESSRVYGGELQYVLTKSTGKLSQNISGGYVFMYPAEFNSSTGKNTGIMLKYRRKHSLTINYDIRLNKIKAGASLFVKSKILNIDDVFLNPLTREDILPGFYDYWKENNKGYFVADVFAGYRISRNFTLSAMVKNLTNTEYMGRPGDIQPQRNFSLRLSGEF